MPRPRCKPSRPGRPVGSELAEVKPFRKITGPATRQAIRRTLRAALNSAIAQQLITFNPASHVELESGKRPKPLLWTEERVRRWRETGETPARSWCGPRSSSASSSTPPRATVCTRPST